MTQNKKGNQHDRANCPPAGPDLRRHPFKEHGVPARTLLCADCQVEREKSLQKFIDSLEDGWSRMEQGPELTVLTYGDGRQEVYPTMPRPDGTAG